MKKKTILKVFFSVLTVFLALTCTLASIKTKKIKADTVSDLTGTTWVLNSNITFAYWVNRWYINFTSNNINYVEFYMGDDEEMTIYYTNTNVYYRGWVNEAYRTITITGGTDVTTSGLISFLQNNATQQQPTPPGTEIEHRYWSIATGFRMSTNDLFIDNDIEYTVLFNEQRRQYDETIQTGLIFKGPTSSDETCYMESVNGEGINILYRSDDDRFLTSCWFEFTPGDYIDEDLYDFMSDIGHWFDDDQAYLCGTSQGYAEGIEDGRALGQADGVEYTNLITNILNGLGNLLNIQIFPNITLGLIIGLPLLLGVFVIIIKILRG